MVLGYKPAKLRVREPLPVYPSHFTHAAAESSNLPKAGDHLPARPHWAPSSLFGFKIEGVQRNVFLLFAFFMESNVSYNQIDFFFFCRVLKMYHCIYM